MRRLPFVGFFVIRPVLFLLLCAILASACASAQEGGATAKAQASSLAEWQSLAQPRADYVNLSRSGCLATGSADVMSVAGAFRAIGPREARVGREISRWNARCLRGAP